MRRFSFSRRLRVDFWFCARAADGTYSPLPLFSLGSLVFSSSSIASADDGNGVEWRGESREGESGGGL